MHPADCTCRSCCTPIPITTDDAVRLALFLAGRGHIEAAYRVFADVAYEAMLAGRKEVA